MPDVVYCEYRHTTLLPDVVNHRQKFTAALEQSLMERIWIVQRKKFMIGSRGRTRATHVRRNQKRKKKQKKRKKEKLLNSEGELA